MCIIALNWQPGRPLTLTIAANRDESRACLTLGLHHWPVQGILAGPDLQASGTRLGLSAGEGTHQIRMAALTNYRDVTSQRPDTVSRGYLTAAFMNSSVSAKGYLQKLSANTHFFNPFNLIVFDGQTLMDFDCRHARIYELPAGMTGVSNADFNTYRPKLEYLRISFEQTLADHDDEALLQEIFFKLLFDDRITPVATLSKKGISLNRERVLSAAMMYTPDYGTRAFSVIRIKHQGAQFTKRCFDTNGFKGEAKENTAWGNPCLP